MIRYFQVIAGHKVMQKVAGNAGTVTAQQQQGQCVQVSQAMIGSQPTAQIISPLQVNSYYKILILASL